MEGAMRKAQFTVTRTDVQTYAADLLCANIGFKKIKGKCTLAVLLHLLCAAASRLTSLFAICAQLKKAPSAETARKALLATLPDYAKLQRDVNRALTAGVPKPLRQRKQTMAIDLHLRPYYGRPQRNPKEVYRSKAKAGTSNFHAYASAYVVFHGQRFTVALTPVERGEDMKDIVQRLLTLARKASIRPGLLLLDRGFYSIDVIRYLQRARVPFLMPAVARGRKPAKDAPPTGIRAFRKMKRSGWGKHTLVAGKNKASVSICVHCGNHRGKRKKHGRFAWVYAYWGIEPKSTRWVADTYRSRFGIETSYRQLNEARMKTCTRSPLVRFFYVALALLLRNVWVWFHWEVLSTPRRGRRLLRLERLRFKALLYWLLQAAEALLGTDDETLTERPTVTRLIGNRQL
jgi:hypothetical protein